MPICYEGVFLASPKLFWGFRAYIFYFLLDATFLSIRVTLIKFRRIFMLYRVQFTISGSYISFILKSNYLLQVATNHVMPFFCCPFMFFQFLYLRCPKQS